MLLCFCIERRRGYFLGSGLINYLVFLAVFFMGLALYIILLLTWDSTLGEGVYHPPNDVMVLRTCLMYDSYHYYFGRVTGPGSRRSILFVSSIANFSKLIHTSCIAFCIDCTASLLPFAYYD